MPNTLLGTEATAANNTAKALLLGDYLLGLARRKTVNKYMSGRNNVMEKKRQCWVGCSDT